jgi:hypothetical protein
LVERRPEEVTEQQSRDLRKWGFLARDRSPLPGARAIIEAAYRETPEGPVIVDPIDVSNPEHAATLQRAEDQLERIRKGGLDRLIRRLKDDDREQGPRR